MNTPKNSSKEENGDEKKELAFEDFILVVEWCQEKGPNIILLYPEKLSSKYFVQTPTTEENEERNRRQQKEENSLKSDSKSDLRSQTSDTSERRKKKGLDFLQVFSNRIFSSDRDQIMSGTTGTTSGWSGFSDSSTYLTDSSIPYFSYVHRITLHDMQARGYVRPICLCYLTSEPDKIITNFEKFIHSFTLLAKCLKFGNDIIYASDISKHFFNIDELPEEQLRRECVDAKEIFHKNRFNFNLLQSCLISLTRKFDNFLVSDEKHDFINDESRERHNRKMREKQKKKIEEMKKKIEEKKKLEIKQTVSDLNTKEAPITPPKSDSNGTSNQEEEGMVYDTSSNKEKSQMSSPTSNLSDKVGSSPESNQTNGNEQKDVIIESPSEISERKKDREFLEKFFDQVQKKMLHQHIFKKIQRRIFEPLTEKKKLYLHGPKEENRLFAELFFGIPLTASFLYPEKVTPKQLMNLKKLKEEMEKEKNEKKDSQEIKKDEKKEEKNQKKDEKEDIPDRLSTYDYFLEEMRTILSKIHRNTDFERLRRMDMIIGQRMFMQSMDIMKKIYEHFKRMSIILEMEKNDIGALSERVPLANALFVGGSFVLDFSLSNSLKMHYQKRDFLSKSNSKSENDKYLKDQKTKEFLMSDNDLLMESCDFNGTYIPSIFSEKEENKDDLDDFDEEEGEFTDPEEEGEVGDENEEKTETNDKEKPPVKSYSAEMRDFEKERRNRRRRRKFKDRPVLEEVTSSTQSMSSYSTSNIFSSESFKSGGGGGGGSLMIGKNILHFMNHYQSFFKHIAFNLLMGRTLIVFGQRQNRRYVEDIVSCLSVFVPGLLPGRIVPWASSSSMTSSSSSVVKIDSIDNMPNNKEEDNNNSNNNTNNNINDSISSNEQVISSSSPSISSSNYGINNNEVNVYTILQYSIVGMSTECELAQKILGEGGLFHGYVCTFDFDKEEFEGLDYDECNKNENNNFSNNRIIMKVKKNNGGNGDTIEGDNVGWLDSIFSTEKKWNSDQIILSHLHALYLEMGMKASLYFHLAYLQTELSSRLIPPTNNNSNNSKKNIKNNNISLIQARAKANIPTNADLMIVEHWCRLIRNAQTEAWEKYINTSKNLTTNIPPNLVFLNFQAARRSKKMFNKKNKNIIN